MKKDDWQKIKELFHRVLEQKPENALTWLEQQVPQDSEIYRQVAAMLSEDREQHKSITNIVSAEVENTLFSRLALHPGDRLGAYEIEAPVGEGGMGAVFIARRVDEIYDQKVAIKIITGKSLNSDTISRFQRERQILANLNNKHIARLFDGGTTDNGLPYLVMEYVHGRTLLDYCAHHKLKFTKKMALFHQVCEAVHYAHQNLVVHRDIKSSNILVDENGEIKLLDFGVAKILEPEMDETANDQTQIEVRILTPRSASPEQVKGEAITTGTDVYALGALLYEMLTGKPLFDAEGMSRIELERIICEQSPQKPSQVLKEKANNAAPEKRQRYLAAAKNIAGDLDTIILKSVEKETARRYSSVQAFTDDLYRYQQHFPILARPQGKTYRFARFFQRHTLTTVLGSTLAILVLVSTVYIWSQSNALRKERNNALHQARVADETKEFIAQLFREADPYYNSGNIPNALELLDKGYAQIETLESGDDIKSSLLVTIADVFMTLGNYDKAREALDRAGTLMDSNPNVQAKDKAKRLYYLGSWYFYQGQYEQAKETQEQALALHLNSEEPDAREIAEIRHELAGIYTEMGNHIESEKILREVLIEFQHLLGDSDPALGHASAELAHTLRQLGKNEESLTFLEKALAIYERAYGRQHLDTAYALNQMASTLKDMQQYNKALTLAQEGLDIRRKIHGEHEEVAASLGMMSHLYKELGDYQQAEHYRRESLAMLINLVGETHPYVGGTYGSLGALQIQQEKYADALASYRLSVEILQKALPPNAPNLIRSFSALSELEREYGNNERALEVAQAAFDGGNNNDNLRSTDRAKILENYGRALWPNAAMRSQATTYLNEARQIYIAEDSERFKQRIAEIDALLTTF